MTEQTPLRIIRIIARLNIGGPARHALILSHGLAERGYDTLLVFGSVGTHETSFAEQLGAPKVRNVYLQGLGRAIRPWHDLRTFLELLRLMRAERPDIVHTHTAKAGVLGRLAALAYNLTRTKNSRCLVVHTFHGNVLKGYFGMIGNIAVRWSERALALVTDRIITISASQRDEIVREFRVAPAAKVDVVPLGLELRSLVVQALDRSLRTELGFDGQDVVFGFVGRFAPIKNLSLLVRAFSMVVNKTQKAKLVLVGGGECRVTLENLVAELRLGNSVRFLGWRSDLSKIYGAMDVVVLSSLNEGTPVALIEAMAAGRPVVATRVGGIADLVRDGETGFLVPSGDVRALGEAMARLILAPAERAAVGAVAQREVAGKFDSERLITETDRLYRSALMARDIRSA
jgi:glycosyltransferase involved in cell wall biosynthesis